MADQETPEVTAETTTTPAPKPEAATTTVETAAPAVTPKPEGVAVSPEQVARWKQIEADHATLKAEEDKRKADEAQAAEDRLVEEGKLKEVIANKERLIAERDRKSRENDTRFRATTRDSQLAFALAKHPLTEGSADQLLRLFRDDLEVVEDGDSFRVQSRDGRPVEKFVAENLAHKDFSKFVAAKTKGGSPPSNAGNSEPPKAPERPNVEQRQVDSLKVSARVNATNRLAGMPSYN